MLDARNIFDPSPRFLVKINNRLAAWIFHDRQRNLRRQNIMRVKSGRNILQADKTFHQQAGADEQNKSENGFGDDETVAQPTAMSSGSRTASAFVQRFAQLGLRTDQRRHEAKENSGKYRNTKSHRKYTQVEIDFTKSRHSVPPNHSQDVEPPDREQHTCGSS